MRQSLRRPEMSCGRRFIKPPKVRVLGQLRATPAVQSQLTAVVGRPGASIQAVVTALVLATSTSQVNAMFLRPRLGHLISRRIDSLLQTATTDMRVSW
jgi:hypothetical protein